MTHTRNDDLRRGLILEHMAAATATAAATITSRCGLADPYSNATYHAVTPAAATAAGRPYIEADALEEVQIVHPTREATYAAVRRALDRIRTPSPASAPAPTTNDVVHRARR